METKLQAVLSAGLWVLLWIGVLAAPPSMADSGEKAKAATPSGPLPPEVGIQHETGEGYRRLQAVVPGRILSLRTLQQPQGGSSLLLLVAPEGDDQEAPRALFRLSSSGEGELVELSRTIPPETTSWQGLFAETASGPAFLDGPEGLSRLEMGTGEVTLHAVTGDLAEGGKTRARRALAGPSVAAGERLANFLPMVEVGRLSLFQLRDDRELGLTREMALPIAAQRKARSLLLTSPPVTELPRAGQEPSLFLVGPEPHGDRRLRTLFLDPALEEGEGQAVEAWSQLPGPEAVDRSWYAWLDDRPVLLVTTLRSDKLGLLEKQKLRLFRLAADRTRAGRKPTLEVLTETRHWYQIEPQILDITGDGRDDLVVIQPEGLGAGKLVVEAFIGLGGGLFRQSSRRSVIGAEDGIWHFGKDLNGDGAADLVVLAEDEIRIFTGTPAHQRRVVDRKAWRSFPLEGSSSDRTVEISVGMSDGENQSEVNGFSNTQLRLQDTDGDGRSEILLSRTSQLGRDIVQIYWLGS
ncbi:MAG: VCBS repeat-containing protein [Deltaproteobacteria bacterium]|nr:VCBS repeat-containing protein [Deltaproteobacteria bacterium]